MPTFIYLFNLHQSNNRRRVNPQQTVTDFRGCFASASCSLLSSPFRDCVLLKASLLLSFSFGFCFAAGRKSVIRRRESYSYSSTQELDYCKNGSIGVEVNASRNHHFIHNGFRAGKAEREQDAISIKHGVYRNDEGLPPPEKRRKFSPIVWDLQEKEAKISTKNRVTQVTAPSPSQPNSPLADGVLHGFASRASPGPCVLPHEQLGNDYPDVDVENNAQGWNVKMSRWADDDEYKRGNGSSSPELGEFRQECSESTITRSSGSSGREHYLGHSTDDADSEKEFLTDSIDDIEEPSDVSDSPSDSDESGGLMHVQRNINMLQGCRSVCEFEMIKKINEGTYGVVYKARDKKTGELAALKKVKMNIERDGFPMSALREINILLAFNHPSIVDVKEVVVDNYDGTFMVMEYMEHDLKGLLEAKKQPFSIGEIKSLMLQLLEGVKYLHDNWIQHRDLKTSNILLNIKGELKICDFGMSRQFGSPRKPYTPVVVTLWYRAPELLLGEKEYSTAIDMWSVGCIMAELVTKEPLFMGKTEVEQLDKIFRTLGTPDEKIWPGLSKLPGSKAKFVKQPYNMLRKKFPAASFTGAPILSELGFDLLKKLLSYDPEKRITAEEALLHDWFREAPQPKSDFNIFPSWRG